VLVANLCHTHRDRKTLTQSDLQLRVWTRADQPPNQDLRYDAVLDHASDKIDVLFSARS